jgi:hypothetical protein
LEVIADVAESVACAVCAVIDYVLINSLNHQDEVKKTFKECAVTFAESFGAFE